MAVRLIASLPVRWNNIQNNIMTTKLYYNPKARILEPHPLCGLLKRDLKKQGLEVQTFGFSNANECIYAGVHFVPELTPKWIYRLHTHWARWRKWYDNLPENRKRDYPAKHNPVVAFTGARPIDQDCNSTKWLRVSQIV